MNRSDNALLNHLDAIAVAMEHFGSLVTNRRFPRSTMLDLVRRGYAQSSGVCQLVDDDGFPVEPERLREGFELTYCGADELLDLRRRAFNN